MYHDKTIYILKAYVEESVMGRVFFQGGAPPPLTGGATAPHFFKKKSFSKKYIFSYRKHSTESYEQKYIEKFGPGGAQPPQGLLPPIFSKYFFLQKIPKTKYILNQQHLVCLMSKKKVLKIWPRGGLSPPFT